MKLFEIQKECCCLKINNTAIWIHDESIPSYLNGVEVNPTLVVVEAIFFFYGVEYCSLLTEGHTSSIGQEDT